MPISSSTLTYQSDRVGTSGVGMGLQLAVVNSKAEEPPPETVRHNAVQGPPSFMHYKNGPVGEATAYVSELRVFSIAYECFALLCMWLYCWTWIITDLIRFRDVMVYVSVSDVHFSSLEKEYESRLCCR